MKLCEFDVGKDVDITAHRMRTLTLLLAGLMAAGVSMPGMASTLPAPQQDQRPVFRSSAARVTLAVTVRDRRGRPVTDLTRADFSLLDRGQPRVIQDFSRDAAPVGIALLADVSGSMDVAEKKAATRQIASQLVASLRAGEDQVGLFAFDRGLEEIQALDVRHFVPGHGNLMILRDVVNLRDAMLSFYEGVKKGFRNGQSESEIRQSLDLSIWNKLERSHVIGRNINRAYLEVEKESFDE